MKRRRLGSTGIEVGEIGIGTWELAGDVWGAKDDAASLAAIRAGVDAGADFIDTAADYGHGHVESLIGRLLSDGSVRRQDVVVSTKVRPACGVFTPKCELPITEFYRPSWIRSECEASLRRLGSDYVDVLFLHTWSKSWGHEDAWFEEMQRLKSEGKIRAIGISVPDEGVTDANVQIARGQIDIVQCVCSVFQQEPEYALLPLADKFGVGVVARSPFSSGALVQSWATDMVFPEGDWRATWPARVKEDWLAEQVTMSRLVDGLIRASGLDRPAFCLKYVLGHPQVSTVIPGTANPEHMRINLAASVVGPDIDEETRRRLEELWVQRRIHGTYNGSA